MTKKEILRNWKRYNGNDISKVVSDYFKKSGARRKKSDPDNTDQLIEYTERLFA